MTTRQLARQRAYATPLVGPSSQRHDDARNRRDPTYYPQTCVPNCSGAVRAASPHSRVAHDGLRRPQHHDGHEMPGHAPSWRWRCSRGVYLCNPAAVRPSTGAADVSTADQATMAAIV